MINIFNGILQFMNRTIEFPLWLIAGVPMLLSVVVILVYYLELKDDKYEKEQ